MKNFPGSQRNLVNILISLMGIGIVVLYSVCGQSCLYLKGNIFSLDLKYFGILLMGVVIFLTLLRTRSLLMVLLSCAIGGEIYLVGFQVKNGAYCPYCLAFGAALVSLFLFNFDSSKKVQAIVFVLFGLLVFSFVFEGSVTPVWGGQAPLTAAVHAPGDPLDLTGGLPPSLDAIRQSPLRRPRVGAIHELPLRCGNIHFLKCAVKRSRNGHPPGTGAPTAGTRL